MIQFMVIGAPRSGTAWAANWLTTDHFHCLHDPLMHHHWADWDKLEVGHKALGIACTGVAVVAPHFLKQHPARKVIVHRPISDINRSLTRLRLSMLSVQAWEEALNAVPGMHVNWLDLFEKPRPIWEYLTGQPLDEERHRALARLHVELHPLRAAPDPKLWQRLVKEIQGAAA